MRGERAIYNFKRQCIEHSLYGVDIDSGAVEIAKLRLWLSLVVDEDDIKNIKPLPNLDYKIVCGNSLLGVKRDLLNDSLFQDLEKLKPLYFNETNPTKKQEYKNQIDDLIIKITNGHKEFDFEVHFSEVFHHKGGFDVVIANPPYVSVKSISSDDKVILSKEFDTGQGRFNLFTLFLEKGHKLLSLNGILTFIIPEGIYSHVEYRHTRNYLLNNTAIILINLFSNKVFEAAVDTTILSIKNRKDNQGKFCVYRDLSNKVFELNQKLFQEYPFNLFAVNLTSQAFNIIDRFIKNKSFDILENVLEIQQGIIYSGQPKNKVFANFPKDKTFKKVLDGRDILKWRINWDNKIDNKYISYTAKLHRPREERLFIGKEKILLPRKSTKISCAYDTEQYYALNTAYICLLTNNDYHLKFILSLLNSKFINFFYSSLFLGWQITIPALNALPIKKLENDQQQPFITLVDQILAAKKKDPNADTSALERQIDKMVYELYGLTPEEIEIVEGKK